ncbi:MAG: phage terminase large subunit [Eubacteriales bacterium]|nr:phage terminase large subunit [Eubacteriales bacterium]
MREYTMEKPNPRQKEFFLARSRFVAYGGARGGGKSWAVRRKAALSALYYPGIRILVMRRSYPQLRENHILPMMKELAGIAEYRESDKSFSFPNGSRIRFGYCDADTDTMQYQGQEYDLIFIDEATQVPFEHFVRLKACLRGANDFPKRIYLTCNPGGIGHAWVKRLFIDRIYAEGENPEDYTFIRAGVKDNAALLKRDRGYVEMLQSLPPELRRAWLDGEWDVLAGRYFTEFSTAAHVIEPFVIPEGWRWYGCLDYGLDMLAAYLIAVDFQGKAYVTREVYRSGLIVSEAAAAVRAAFSGVKITAMAAPPDLWSRRQDTGKSAAQIFAENGVTLTRASADRVAGWYNLKEWLHADEEGRPRLRIFRNCVNLIRTLPQLTFSETDPNDCAVQPHEITHAPDALRYFCSYRSRSAGAQETTEADDQVRRVFNL